MMFEGSVTPVILAGGLGKRLRPLTNHTPKPFLKLLSRNSLFQDAVLRSSGFAPPIIVCHESYYKFVKAHLAEINVTPRAIILEPEHKGTAAAIAMAAFYLKNQGECMMVMPSDHVLSGGQEFDKSISNALNNVSDNIVALGAVPTRPETGYGYMVCDDSLNKVSKFIEKPDFKAAKELIKQGNCLWHTGIFLSRPRIFLNELKQHAPNIHKLCERAFYAGDENAGIYIPDAKDFTKIASISVDYAILENTQKLYVSKMNCSWCDVGVWSRLIRFKIMSMFG